MIKKFAISLVEKQIKQPIKMWETFEMNQTLFNWCLAKENAFFLIMKSTSDLGLSVANNLLS